MNEIEQQRAELLAPALRIARRNMRYIADELDCVGIMLNSGGITMRQAIDWLDDLGITGYVGEITIRLVAEEAPEKLNSDPPWDV